ncbi:hypothetical protein FB451DRAFT_1184469 [Mycena latifolia]|nr:hypothetical protein FB451DRAFT_1184469 [Mycena latifolia]
MDAEHQEGFERLQDLAADENFRAGDVPETPNMVNMGDILDGSARIEISHAGGEFASLEQEVEDASGDEDAGSKARKQADWRTRRDRTELQNVAFQAQMPEMLSAYFRMCAEGEIPIRPDVEEEDKHEAVEEIYELTVVDMFDTSDIEVKLDPHANGIAPTLILQGMMPCAPWEPTVAIKIRVLEAYRVTHVCCPQLAIQSYVKALCDIHGVAYRPYLCQQFSIAYDLYLNLRQRTDERILHALGRDSSWRLKHACPACMYKLEGEDELIFSILTTMDGNDSLKRVLRREKTTMAQDEADDPTLAKSRERVDNRDVGDGYYISCEKVDKWAKSRLGEQLPMQSGNADQDNPCADRWKNMINDVTSKMWGIFDETGIFLALCRHGFVIVLADMIKSGELAKYPLVVVNELLGAFGLKIGAGYDVGCHFGVTVDNSELGEEAREKGLKCLVGSFHGHAHNRLCQLHFLATYVEGMGLEDLEGCERYFSWSNGLAKSCRYASRFHRQQEITTYAKHVDSFETYANLSKFLVSNYHQALQILKTEAALKTWMEREGVEEYKDFHKWLAEEKAYLLSLKDTPKEKVETLEMEYVQKLVNLNASQAKHSVVAAEARCARGDDGSYEPGVPKAELARRQAREKMERDLDSVLELEAALEIEERWTTASPKWVAMADAVKKRKYQLALDALELLIVERIFELTKMNRSQTGYKMRKHIAKALQARSKAVRSAIDCYNSAACTLTPPMPQLSWEQVVEYAFLADFDILWDTRAEIQLRPWTRPAYQLAMDRYFRTLHAREEIKHLNVEIPRVVTWIRDENAFLRKMETNLRDEGGKSEEQIVEDVQMAVQVCLYRRRRGHFDAGHMRRFYKLAAEPGFTGSLECGVAIERREIQERLRELREQAAREAGEMEVDGREAEIGDDEDEWVDDVPARRVVGEDEGSDEEGEGDEARDVAVSDVVYQISMLAVDGKVAGAGDAD